MMTPQDLSDAFSRNTRMAREMTQGLSQADSVLQPPFQGNCLNWVLGHIAQSRNEVLQRLGQTPILTEAEAKRYGYGSEPVCAEGGDIIRLERLLALLTQAGEGIAAALEEKSPEALAQRIDSFLGPVALEKLVFFLQWHETYHLGQVELLRELAGPKA